MATNEADALVAAWCAALPYPAEDLVGTANDAWANMDPSVKSFLCVAITAVAALIEVTSTMVLAYPEHRAKEKGYTQTPFYQRLQMGGNVALMLLAVAVYTVGSFFGPVSLSVPAAMAAKLMWNMVELGVVLRMSEFAKEARVGTYILIISIVAMPGIGPTDQPDLDILQAMLTLPSIIWLSILCAATLACCVGMVIIKLRPGTLSTFTVYAILLTGQVTSAVVGTSAALLMIAVINIISTVSQQDFRSIKGEESHRVELSFLLSSFLSWCCFLMR